MSQIIKESEYVEEIYYTIDYNFKHDPGSGFTFPSKNGTMEIDTEKISNPAMFDNIKFCQKNHNGTLVGPRLVKHIARWKQGPMLQCDCGNIFELQNEIYGACECPECNQWYNLFGQKLTSPYGDEFEDLYNEQIEQM